MKFSTMKEEITKYQIKEDIFIKVLSFDEKTNAVNVNIFYKVNNKYRNISQAELPKDIVNIIASKKSEPMTMDEINDFEKYLDKVTLDENNIKISNLQTIFGKCLHTNYILTKDKNQDYYILQQAITNEFGIMVATTPIISAIIPYVFADVINVLIFDMCES